MSHALTLGKLRAHAITHSLFPPTTLRDAIDRLGFVQAEPIRCPAPAQDLILRHRVSDYSVGDLSESYSALRLEEDVLYAYGFMPLSTWECLRSRRMPPMSDLERKVLPAVAERGPTQAGDLDDQFGRDAERNDWGGISRATKQALDALHRRGLLRVCGRRNGVRIYERSRQLPTLDPAERITRVALLVADLFSPVRKKSVRALLARIGRALIGQGAGQQALTSLLEGGLLCEGRVDGVAYVWPKDSEEPAEPPGVVRFLAPFDPVIHDRERFEQLWGWGYRFEAYTPAERRVRGYYAMPILWGDQMVGWANARAVDDAMHIDFGFVRGRPVEARFERELEAEVQRLRAFLCLGSGGGPHA